MKKLSFFLMAMLMSIMSFAETYTHTFVKGEMKTGSVTLSGVTWNTAADPGTTAYNWDGQATAKGIQIGTKSAPCESYTFSTSHFVDYMVTNITVNASIASSGTAKMQVSVGGVDYIAQTALTTTATNYTGSGASQGDVVISFTNTSKAFYIKSISITYQAVSAGEGMILVDQSNVDFGKMTKTKTIVVTGQNLTSVITTSLKEGANFTVAGNLTAEGGELTVNYIATEAGKHTDVLVLTSDDVTTEVALAGEVVVLEGAGTKENPYTVADVIALGLTDKTQAWVEGYIIGTMKDNALEETPSQYSNIVLAAAADVKENYVPVALASGTNPRAALNIIDNPTMLGAKVAVYGTLETYYSKPGVKNVSDYEILSTVTPEPAMFTVTVTAENGTVTGAGTYEEGKTATLTATAAEGYEFVNWTSGETEVSTANPFTFTVTSDTTLVANFAVVEPEVIAYELNGGELPAPAVPTNEELWIAFMPYYQEYYDVVRAEQPIASVAVFLSAGMGDDATIFTSEDSDYKWLGDYIIKVTTEQSAALTTLANWKFNAQAFFNANQYTGWPKSADFTEAGKPEAWGAAYQAAHAVVLPTEPVDAPYTLPTPVKDGFTFVGWYDNAEGTGEAYTVIPTGWAGTLYAIWKQGPTTALENIAVEGKAVKAIVNGQLIIIKNGVQYNAQGQVIK